MSISFFLSPLRSFQFVIPATAGIHSSTRESGKKWNYKLGKPVIELTDAFLNGEIDSRCNGNDKGIFGVFLNTGGSAQ